MPKTYKLVLSGSGTRYPCFIGAVKRLLEEGIEIDEVCGTSGGGIIAAGLGWKYDKNNPLSTIQFLEELALNVLPGQLLDPHWLNFAFTVRLGNLFKPGRKVICRNTNGVFKGKKILKELRKNLPKGLKLNIPVRITTFNTNYKKANIWTPEDGVELALLVRATMSLPFIFDPVLINGDLHTDGGATANFPLDVFGEDVDVIGLAFEAGEGRSDVDDKIALAGAHIDGMMMATMKEDIRDAGPRARVCRIRTSHAGLNLNMSRRQVEDQIREGYESVSKWLKDNPI